MFILPLAFIALGIILLAAFVLLRRSSRTSRTDAIFAMIKQLPLLKDHSDLSVAATVRSKMEYKILVEHKACQAVKGGVLANFAVLDARDSRVVGVLPERLIDHSGQCTIPAYHGLKRTDITFSIANG